MTEGPRSPQDPWPARAQQPYQPPQPYYAGPASSPSPPPSKRPWYTKKRFILPLSLVLLVIVIAATGVGSNPRSVDTARSGAAPSVSAAATTPASRPEGVYPFGDTVTFKDGSTLTAAPPREFAPSEYSSGGEDSATHIFIKLTFTNNTTQIYDPSLTSDSVSSLGEEGDSIFQEGFDSPDNKLLPGQSVTWRIAYGVKSVKSVTLTERMGFLSYDDVIFTSES